MANKDYLGKGWAFPPHFDIESKNVDMVSEDEDIKQSLGILLSTHMGERYLVPRFGCDITDFLFKLNSNAQKLKLRGIISDAIAEFEPRITLEDIVLDNSEIMEGKLIMDIRYTINATNTRSNIVYPFCVEK